MHFCVIGDSWGGNSNHSAGIFQETLARYNHTVDNLSQPGASNRGQLRKLEYEYLTKLTADVIIWIYTEPARDFNEFVNLRFSSGDNNDISYPELTYTDFYKDLKYLAMQDFKYAQCLYDTYNIPFVIIGAAGQVDPIIDTFTFSIWTLHNWSQEISDMERMPINCYIDHPIWMAEWKNTYNREEFLEEIHLLEKLKKLMLSNPVNYPDGRHASKELYPPLIERILENIKEKI